MFSRYSRSSGVSLRRSLPSSHVFPAIFLAAAFGFSSPVFAALTLAAGFPGAADDGTGVPPDVQGAAGPDDLLVMLNTVFLAQRKSDGAAVRQWTPDTFWAPVAAGDRLFDPRVLYDAGAGRWIAAIATEGFTADPAILLAVSDGPDPTAGWSFRKLAAGNGAYVEFPLIGYNGRWVVVAANLISGTTGNLSGTAVWSVEKSTFAVPGGAGVTRFTLPVPGSPVAPVADLDAESGDAFLVQTLSGNDAGHGKLRLYRVSANGGAPALTLAATVSAPVTWSAMPLPIESLPQAGTSRKIVSDQDEIASVCLRNGAIWVVQTATVSANGPVPLHTAVQWWRIAPGGTREAFGRIEDPSGTIWLGFPSVSVSGDGEAIIGYSLFSADRFASGGYSLRSACGGDAGLSEIHVLKSGEAPYERLDGAGNNRWGDLSETVVDPDGARLWTLQEFAAATANGQSRWGTWWGEFAPSTEARGGACLGPVKPSPPVTIDRRGP